ncbi:MAG: LirA/MavJ family T4SS effector [Rubrivivax sp.]
MGNTVFASAPQALESLKKNKFAFTKALNDGGRQTADHPQFDAYIAGYAAVAALLCDQGRFDAALTAVSEQLWDAYMLFTPDTRNKFSRALNKVASSYGFSYQTRFQQDTSHTRPIGIKLIGGDPQLGFMLRGKLFWKDSMDLRHGEHTHSLQWLAAAQALPNLVPTVANLYAQTGEFRAASKDDMPGQRSMLMWQWLADCFPTDMNNLATAQFLNGETLESHSARSPQFITDLLLKRNAGPIPGHFVSTYLFHRYKNRNWLKAEQVWDKALGAERTQVSKFYTGDPTVAREGSVGAQSWTPSQRVPNRLLRDTTQYVGKHDGAATQSYQVTLHNKPGVLSFYHAD